MSLETFTQFITSISREVDETSSLYGPLKAHGLRTFPLPFFGRVDEARVLTIGVNPSMGEFRGRDWPDTLSYSQLTNRLLNYFHNEEVKPHPWFRTWERGLRRLGYSYLTGQAAHLDISPRATIAMSECEPELFLEMCFRDVAWMLRLLEDLKEPKLLLMAGAVTKHYYMNDFIRIAAEKSGWRLLGQGEEKGRGRVGYHILSNDSCQFPSFFCSVSPSSRGNINLLLRRIEDNAPRIKGLVEEHNILP